MDSAAANELALLRQLAKSLSNALLKVRPLGGSELFIYTCGDYYADPQYCGRLIDELRNENIELRKAAVLERRSSAVRREQ